MQRLREDLTSIAANTVADHSLSVNIAERPRKRTHRISYRNVRRTHISEADSIIERPIRSTTPNKSRASNSILPTRDTLILPRPPHTINHTVMRPKCRICRRVLEIAPRVAADGVMTWCTKSVVVSYAIPTSESGSYHPCARPCGLGRTRLGTRSGSLRYRRGS
jgi:hypothetical protein